MHVDDLSSTSRPPVVVVRTGTANLASVLAALRRCETEAEANDDAKTINAAERVVLPGVGSFAAAVQCLTEHGLNGRARMGGAHPNREGKLADKLATARAVGSDQRCRIAHGDLGEVLRRRVRDGRPTLGICLGLQVLCERSAESPGVAGLGVLPGEVTRFPDGVRVPQLGWNRVQPDAGCRLLLPGYAYFANSYRLTECPAGWSAAYAEHGGRFVAGLERGAVLLCQFHPELSGAWGLALLRRWLSVSAENLPC